MAYRKGSPSPQLLSGLKRHIFLSDSFPLYTPCEGCPPWLHELRGIILDATTNKKSFLKSLEV